ncbi:TPA: cell division protein FtsZ [Patescibacteria group bacterium]|nr:MAG: Cell division protein FtsZ [Parcubacteria group bacterium GW2011_GWA2_46_39]HBV33580.1 cell division protein FtsZ [Patescibacteria group bacterium]
MEVKPAIETFAKIKVIGVGGSGGAAINRMVSAKTRGVEFIAVNTDAQALHQSRAGVKVQIGKETTRGLGAGMDPELGAESAEEAKDDIKETVKNADMVFLTCGLGGGTGSGASPLVAEIAQAAGSLTIAVVTKPFSFEGAQRRSIAERALAQLTDKVDTIITIPNDRILQLIDKKTTLLEAFTYVDEVLRQGVQGISDIITIPGLINVDFADVKAIMAGAGSALMGIGIAKGENKAVEAAKSAIESPLLEMSVDGAKGILFTITGGPDLSMYDVNEAARVITASADPNAKIIFGAIIDENLKDEIRITVIATGFSQLSKKNITQVSASAPSYSPLSFFKSERAAEAERKSKSKKAEVKERPPMPSRAPIYEETEPVDMMPEDKGPDEDYEIPAFIRKKLK